MCIQMCECGGKEGDYYSATDSREVILNFDNGHAWLVPGLALHQIKDHGLVPQKAFVADVLQSQYVGGEVLYSKSVIEEVPTEVVLHEASGERVPDWFVYKLESLMNKADRER